MRILFFNYEFPPLGAGAGNASFYLLKEYAKIPNIEMDFVTSSIDENYHREEIGGGVVLHRLPIGKNKENLHFQSQKDLIVYSWRAFLFAQKLTREKKYDATHSFFTVPCGFLSFVLKFQKKIPYIVSLRGSDVPGYSDRFAFLYIFLKPIIWFIWKNADFVVANSQGLKELALKTNQKQDIKIIYNGVDIHDFTPSESKNSELFIITNGATRVTHRKGLDYLIRAVAKIVLKHNNVQLKIMGDGNAKEDLEKLIKELHVEENVKLIGRVPREQTSPFYKEASVFVMSSLNEGMSNAMLEALASGLPLISTKTGGADELITEGENGFFVRMKNSDDIAEKLQLLIDDHETQKKMGQMSRLRAEQMSWKVVANQYVELYKTIDNSRKMNG